MESNYGRLVTMRTKDNFEIIGMLFNSGNSKDKIIIHIHGNFGNFYQNKFLWFMSSIYTANGIDFLTINLSSHDGLAEGYYGRDLKYVGGAVAEYDKSQDDIKAAIDFAINQGYKHVILQGHSLGCDKVIQYALENDSNVPLILLSPVDSYEVQSDWINPETVESQIVRLKKDVKNISKDWGMADLDWLSPNEYGARGDTADWVYQIPVTRNALLSILEGGAFKYLRVRDGMDFHIKNPVYVFSGKHDGLQMHDTAVWIDFISKHFENAVINSELDSDHDIVGVERELSNSVVQWALKL